MNDVFIVHYHIDDVDIQYLVCAKCQTIMKNTNNDNYECSNCGHNVTSTRVYPRCEKISSSICKAEDELMKLI